MKNSLISKIISSILLVGLMVNSNPIIEVSAAENFNNNVSNLARSNFNDSESEFSIDINITDDNIKESFVVDDEEYTLKIEDITPLEEKLRASSLEENWGYATRTKRISLSSATTDMTATFSITTNPYTASINSITEGRYTSVIGYYIKERYYFERHTTAGPSPALGSYEVDHTTNLGGTYTSKLQGAAYVGGRVTFKYYGM